MPLLFIVSACYPTIYPDTNESISFYFPMEFYF